MITAALTSGSKQNDTRASIDHSSDRLKLQAADVLDVRRLARPIERDDDGKTDRHFRRRDSDDEENEDLRVVVGQAAGIDAEAGKRDERKIGRVQHQLERHENDDDVAAQHHAGKTDREKQPANEQIIAERDHIIAVSRLLRTNDADRRDQDEDADDLKRQIVIAKEKQPDIPNIVDCGSWQWRKRLLRRA